MPQNGLSWGRLGGRVGLGLAAVGLLVIGLGINGASGQLTVLAQVPYLISGGMFGLALVILGAAMLVVQSGREDRALLETRLELLTEAVLEARDGAGGPSRPTTAPEDISGLVVVGRSSFHMPDCRLVEGRGQTDYLTPGEAVVKSLKPCRVCRPEQHLSPPVTVS